MKITDDRARDLLRWLDDQAGDHTHLFEQMTLYRDAAALIRQLRDAEQSAWHAGLDAGREQGRGKDHAQHPPSAPVGVEGLSASLRDARERMIAALGPRFGEAFDGDFDVMRDAADALAQQPAAVDEEGVDRAVQAWFESSASDDRASMREAISAYLSIQPGGSDNDR